ncbi:MAG TPA: sulfatase-like hydrolase/transferase, partial [Blastocatellia bacterium]|nr:sulfatase-like hydrolase/transferase [Blastocatellia bacterium]
ENTFPGGNWTMPSHATMLTGLDATSHTIWSWAHRFAPGTKTAFDLFHDAGYKTGCFAIPQLGSLFSDSPIDYNGTATSPGLLKCISGDDPFFVFWHTYNVHYPYGMVVPKDYNDARADYDHPSRALNYIRHLVTTGQEEVIYDSYRREIANAARFLRIIANKLKALGKLENTYFIITADHGEAWEPYVSFHCNFNEAVINIPLIISGPDILPSRISNPVSSVNLLPTVLDLCSAADGEAMEGFDGESLTPLMARRTADDRPLVIAGPDGIRNRHRYLAVRQRDWMLISGLGYWRESFHRINGDGVSANLLDSALDTEAQNILDEFRAVAERHSDRLQGRKDHVVELSDITEKKLKAFGYV